MKKIFLSFALMLTTLVGFSQSFSVDSKGVAVPRYTDLTAIQAITGQTVGQMVYNNATNKHMFWNGSAWTDVSSGSGGANVSVAGNLSVAGTSAMAGKVTIGTASNTTSGLEVRSSFGTDANPDIYLKGINNVIRFGNNVDGTSIIQTTTLNNTPGSANLSWKHITNATPAVATEMMRLDGEGDLTVHGFTKIGGSAADVPAIKTKLITGTITAAANPETAASLTTTVNTGIAGDKIVDVMVLLKANDNIIVAERFSDNRPSPGVGYEFTYLIGPTNMQIIRNNGNSGRLATISPGYAATYKVLITYIP